MERSTAIILFCKVSWVNTKTECRPYSHVFNSRVAMPTVRHTNLLVYQPIEQIAAYSGTDNVIIIKKVSPELG
jgi:hypothetical protein